MIVVNATVVANESTIAALHQAIATMESASRAEAGCDDYTFSIEMNNPNIVRITERWQTADALKAHFGTPHMADFQKAMAAHPPESVTANFYEAQEIPMPQP